MLWQDIESFVVTPLRTVDRESIQVINQENLEAWAVERDIAQWIVPELEHAWRALTIAYKAERMAANVANFRFNARTLNVGGNIEARSSNLYQDKPHGLSYLQYMEVLIRTDVLKDSGTIPFKILTINEQLKDLKVSATTLNKHAKVINVTDDLVGLSEGSGSRRRVATSDAIVKILNRCKRTYGKRIHLIMANCVLNVNGDVNKMLNKDERYMENQQIFSFIFMAIKLLASGGSIILRVHGSNDGHFVANIFALSLLFEQVSFLKPLVGTDSDMEMFIVARSFQQQNVLRFQQRIIASIDDMILHRNSINGAPPLKMSQIPRSFISNLALALIPLLNFTINCKFRNAEFTFESINFNDPIINEELERSYLEAKQIKTKIVSAWMLALRLDKIYYEPNGTRVGTGTETSIFSPVNGSVMGTRSRLQARRGKIAGSTGAEAKTSYGDWSRKKTTVESGSGVKERTLKETLAATGKSTRSEINTKLKSDKGNGSGSRTATIKWTLSEPGKGKGFAGTEKGQANTTGPAAKGDGKGTEKEKGAAVETELGTITPHGSYTAIATASGDATAVAIANSANGTRTLLRGVDIYWNEQQTGTISTRYHKPAVCCPV